MTTIYEFYLSVLLHKISIFQPGTFRLKTGSAGVALVMAALWLGLAGNAVAETFTVTQFDDEIDAFLGGSCDTDLIVGSNCTLRAAIMEANANGNPDETDTIIIPEGAGITLSIGGNGGDVQGDLDITQDVQILGGELDEASTSPIVFRLCQISAAGMTDRIFHIQNGANVLLQGLYLYSVTSPGNIGGGAVRVSDGSALIIDRSILMNNITGTTGGNGGAILVDSDTTFDRGFSFSEYP